MKTIIAIPCMDMVHTEFVRSLVSMRYVGEIQFCFTECSLIYQARTALCKMAMDAGADYVLWLDSDVVFQPDLMERLMEDIQGRDMVTAVYHARKAPFRPVIWKTIRTGLMPTDAQVEQYDDYPEDGLFEIEGCGFGAVLMKTGVIRDVAETFHQTFAPVTGLGEDLSFCVRARSCGYKIWCDPALQIGHKGAMIIDGNTFRAFSGRNKTRGEDHAEGSEKGAAGDGGGV
jgi:GT2 family glycosyltransferase